MRSIRLGTVGLVCAATFACVDADDPAEDAVPQTPEEVGAAQPGAAVAPAEGPEYLVRMVGLGGAPLTGTAAFEPMGEQTEVTVRLAGAEAGTYQGHIHQGTCEQVGSVVAPLEPVAAAAGGEGESVATVPMPMEQIMTGNTIVAFHAAGGQPIVCGSVPALPPGLPRAPA